MITEIDKAYVAGLFDGEGSVIIGSTNFQGWIELSGVEKDVLDWLVELFGGRVLTISKREGYRQVYRWHLTGAFSCRDFIEAILPYSRIKRERLEIMLEFVGLKNISGRSPRDEQTMLQSAILCAKMQSLNKRGE